MNSIKKIIRKLYFYTGYHPDSNLWIRLIFLLFGIFIFTVPSVLAIKGIYCCSENDLIFFIECTQAAFLYVDALIRHVLLHFHKNELRNLLENQSSFVNKNNLCARSKWVLEFSQKTASCYLIGGALTYLAFTTQPFITGKLPTTTYVPEGYYWKLYLLNFFGGLGVYVTTLVTDVFFLDFATFGIVEFIELERQIQNKKMKQFQEDQLWAQTKINVNQHNFLIRYCKILQKFYSAIFFNYVIFSIGATCMQIYISTNNELSFGNRIKNWVYFTEQLAQSVLYCTFSELLCEVSNNIGFAIYTSQWYDISNLQYKKCLCVIIANSQEKIKFTAYGLIDINYRALVQILKTAMSFYTMLHNLQN